jgi:hypothetical protein
LEANPEVVPSCVKYSDVICEWASSRDAVRYRAEGWFTLGGRKWKTMQLPINLAAGYKVLGVLPGSKSGELLRNRISPDPAPGDRYEKLLHMLGYKVE